MTNSYKSAGVDIEAGEATVEKIKKYAKSTFDKNVLSGIGHFGAFYSADFGKMKNPVLVSSVDGVGTKLKVAFAMDKHDTVGQDLVNHCVNDIAVGGAKPLFFMDYLAFGKLVTGKAEQIIKGFSIACKENQVSLIGGETAEMPGLYAEEEYDMSGTIVGVVDKEKIIDGKTIEAGDLIVGFKSNGLHTNGYSLARKVLLKNYNIHKKFDDMELSLGEELLKVHKSYLKLIGKINSEIKVKAFSHITGGGIIGNTKRVLPKGRNIKIDWNSWEMPPLFQLIQKTGKVADDEMRAAFNLGIGLAAIVSESDFDKLNQIAEHNNETATVIGNIQ